MAPVDNGTEESPIASIARHIRETPPDVLLNRLLTDLGLAQQKTEEPFELVRQWKAVSGAPVTFSGFYRRHQLVGRRFRDGDSGMPKTREESRLMEGLGGITREYGTHPVTKQDPGRTFAGFSGVMKEPSSPKKSRSLIL